MFLLGSQGPASSVEYQRNRMSGIDQIPQSAKPCCYKEKLSHFILQNAETEKALNQSTTHLK